MILAIALLSALLLSAAAPALAAENFDFQAAISEFQPDAFNDNTLTIGQTHRPMGAVWAAGGTCYLSNDAVLTIDAQGNVTAVGEGTCYVAIVATTGMYAVSRYTVTAAAAENPQPVIPTQATKVTLPVKVPGKVTIPEKLQQGLDVDDDEIEEQFEKTTKRVSGFFAFFVPFFVLVLALVIYVMITTAHLHRTSIRPRTLPARCRTGNTITKGAAPRTACPKCGEPYGESNFCPKCGSSKFVKTTFQFPIHRSITAQKFETQLNQWLAENPYIYDCKLSLDTKQRLFHSFVQNKFMIKKATLTFSVSDKPVAHQYGFAFVYHYHLFGTLGYNHDKLIAKWEKNNPTAQVISSQGGHIEHMGSQSGWYAEYYGYIFYQK
jgi:hypothetical protein